MYIYCREKESGSGPWSALSLATEHRNHNVDSLRGAGGLSYVSLFWHGVCYIGGKD